MSDTTKTQLLNPLVFHAPCPECLNSWVHTEVCEYGQLERELADAVANYELEHDCALAYRQERDDARACLRTVYDKLRHLDAIIEDCAEADDPIYRTCAAVWGAVKDATRE